MRVDWQWQTASIHCFTFVVRGGGGAGSCGGVSTGSALRRKVRSSVTRAPGAATLPGSWMASVALTPGILSADRWDKVD